MGNSVCIRSSEFLYRSMMRYFSEWKLRLCLLEGPENRCQDRVGSKEGDWGEGFWRMEGEDVGWARLSLRPGARLTARSTPTERPCTGQSGQPDPTPHSHCGASCREGPNAPQTVPEAGESACWICCRGTASSFLKGDLSSAPHFLCQ